MLLKDQIKQNISDFCKNNHENRIISSPKLFNSFCCVGIDEAGRGPVLGPLVFAGAYIEIKNIDKLQNIGLDDSKKLKEDVRSDLLTQLTDEKKSLCGFEIEIISPNCISNQMLSTEKISLNTISHNATIGIIKRLLDKGLKIREVYVDTVGRDCEKYRAFLNSHFPDLSITVEKQADSKFKIVSAASIFAKVIRDNCIENWIHKEKNLRTSIDCGSGYPSDPGTKNYINSIVDRIFGYPMFVRSSWKTASDIVDKKCIPVEWEDDIDVTSKSGGKRKSAVLSDKDINTSSIMKFYKQDVPKNMFFKSRKMERVRSLFS